MGLCSPSLWLNLVEYFEEKYLHVHVQVHVHDACASAPRKPPFGYRCVIRCCVRHRVAPHWAWPCLAHGCHDPRPDVHQRDRGVGGLVPACDHEVLPTVLCAFIVDTHLRWLCKSCACRVARLWVPLMWLSSLHLCADVLVCPCVDLCSACTGLMHESVNVNNAGDYTRPWFAWANSLFAGLIIKVTGRGRVAAHVAAQLLLGCGPRPRVLPCEIAAGGALGSMLCVQTRAVPALHGLRPHVHP
jgi:hypothetical protein